MRLLSSPMSCHNDYSCSVYTWECLFFCDCNKEGGQCNKLWAIMETNHGWASTISVCGMEENDGTSAGGNCCLPRLRGARGQRELFIHHFYWPTHNQKNATKSRLPPLNDDDRELVIWRKKVNLSQISAKTESLFSARFARTSDRECCENVYWQRSSVNWTQTWLVRVTMLGHTVASRAELEKLNNPVLQISLTV